nr:MAG TPA: hypothetical protein [Caudoviricetes sp.]
MKGSKEKVTLGSGKLYIDEFTGQLPEFEQLLAQMANKEHQAGWIKNGASVEYKPTMTTEKDDLGYVVKEVLTEEEATFKSGLFTWNAETLQKLCSTARIETKGKYRILKIGGAGNDDGKQYVILFVHEDKVEGNCYLVIVGRNSAGFTITYAADSATVIDAEFGCKPQDEDGTLIQFVEEIEEEYQAEYTEEELTALTIDQIKTIAAAKGYTITKTVKSEIITEFLAAQTAAQA